MKANVVVPLLEVEAVKLGRRYALPVNKARAETVEMREMRGRSSVVVSILKMMDERCKF